MVLAANYVVYTLKSYKNPARRKPCGTRNYSALFQIFTYSFIMSSSDNPVAFMMSAMLKPIDFKFLAISIALVCAPSARPSARPISMPFITPFSSAVSKLFLMSRYALRLSSYSRSLILIRFLHNNIILLKYRQLGLLPRHE